MKYFTLAFQLCRDNFPFVITIKSQPDPVNGKMNGAYVPQRRCEDSPATGRVGHRGRNKKGDPLQSGRIKEATKEELEGMYNGNFTYNSQQRRN